MHPVKLFACALYLQAIVLTQPGFAESAAQSALSSASVAEYDARLDHLREVIAICKSNAALCETASVGDDQNIEPEGFVARYGWLRDALDASRNPSLKDRDAVLDKALARVQEEQDEAARDQSPADLPNARRIADSILTSPEFQKVHDPSWLERKKLAILNWLDRLFSGVSNVAQHNPWLTPFILWSLVVLPAAGIAVWAMRIFQRQRFAVRIERRAEPFTFSTNTLDWANLARQRAAEGDWREAIHCIYWATIVMMEGRGLWRQGIARTPREYLRLLRSGSSQQLALRRLTSIFERVWYGQRPANEVDYDGAVAIFESLRTA